MASHSGNPPKSIVTMSSVICCPRGKMRQPKLTQLKSKEGDFEQNEVDWADKVEIRTKTKFLAVVEACPIF